MWYMYYSAIKKNEMMSFAATWMQPEIIILSEEVRERQLYLKYDIKEPIYETDSETENRLVAARV